MEELLNMDNVDNTNLEVIDLPAEQPMNGSLSKGTVVKVGAACFLTGIIADRLGGWLGRKIARRYMLKKNTDQPVVNDEDVNDEVEED